MTSLVAHKFAKLSLFQNLDKSRWGKRFHQPKNLQKLQKLVFSEELFQRGKNEMRQSLERDR